MMLSKKLIINTLIMNNHPKKQYRSRKDNKNKGSHLKNDIKDKHATKYGWKCSQCSHVNSS